MNENIRPHVHDQCARNLRAYRVTPRCVICGVVDADHAPSGVGNPIPLCAGCLAAVEGPDCRVCKNEGEYKGRRCPKCDGVAGKKTEIIPW